MTKKKTKEGGKAKTEEMPLGNSPGVVGVKIPAIDSAADSYERKKDKRCEASPGEIAAKRELKELLASMSIYAQDTTVSVEKSRAEIETILSRYGASRFGYMTSENEAIIGFVAHGKGVKFTLPLPPKNDPRFTHYKARGYSSPRPRDSADAYKQWEQACRAAWRSLGLCIKAKLEAVSCGITSFEAEFLAHFTLPGGGTVGERIIPELEEMRKSGKAPQLLLQ